MSWRATLTEEEREGVEELRRLTIKDCTPKMLEDDSLFFRFMKARDFNLKNAEEMIRKHITWREEYQIDTIVTDYDPPEIIKKHGPVTFFGHDKDGDVVKYLDLGRCDAKGVINSVKRVDIIKYNLRLNKIDLALMRQRRIELGVDARRIFFIVDFDKLTFAQATYKKALDYLILAAKMYQDNYPEVIKHMFIINTSSYFTLLYTILKPFLAPHLQEKIRVFGTDGYQEVLLQLIDADVIPAYLGGSRTDPDGNPNCYSFILYGTDVPHKYYMRRSEKRLSSSPGVKKLTVTRFAKSDIRFDVEEPDSLLEWEFETKSRDVGFGVYFTDRHSEGSKPVELVSKQRMDTYMEPVTGVYKCRKAGTYIIVFDNSYSWIHTKDIFYRARIIRPNDEENSPWT